MEHDREQLDQDVTFSCESRPIFPRLCYSNGALKLPVGAMRASGPAAGAAGPDLGAEGQLGGMSTALITWIRPLEARMLVLMICA